MPCAAPEAGLVAIRSLSIEARLDPAALPRDVLAPPGRPAGEVFWHVRFGAGQQALPVRLSGKTYRRVLRDAEASTTPVVAVFQASLQLGTTAPGLCLGYAGLRIAPRGAGGATSLLCQSTGVGQPAAVTIPWVEASVSLAECDLAAADSGRNQLSLGATRIAVQLTEGGIPVSSRKERVLVLRGRLTANAAGFELVDGKFTVRGDAGQRGEVAQQLAPELAEPEAKPVQGLLPQSEPAPVAHSKEPAPQAPAVPCQAPELKAEAPAPPASCEAKPPVRAANSARRVRRGRASRRAQGTLERGEYDFEAAISEIVREEVGRALAKFGREVEALAQRLGLGPPASNTQSARKRGRGER